MQCLICGSENIDSKKTKMSDFLVARIFSEDAISEEVQSNLCNCRDCTFSFYDRRLTENEEKKLYKDYRMSEYQKEREKYDCWYTAKVNDAINNDKKALQEQQKVIVKLKNKYIKNKIDTALDYGGNEGKTFCPEFNINKQYVYDISDVQTVNGVEKIASADELKSFNFDFIMCNMTLEHISNPVEFTTHLYDIGNKGTYFYFEVPSENPFTNNKFSLVSNIKLITNTNFNNYRLFKHYLNLRHQPYMPMSEHVNFYTPKSMQTLLEKVGFQVLGIEENYEKSILGGTMVLSAVCQK